ncbi:MAG: hypothetical protein ABSH13_20835 [Candidatus Acidiferrum sp.]|jgi:hypothetical protein
MYWGAGSGLGLLTLLGYLSFVAGAVLAWRGRDDIYIWVHDEFRAYRRHLSRFTPAGPFYSPREESRLKVIPTEMVRTLSCIPRSRYIYAASLLVLGPILVLLDFFI